MKKVSLFLVLFCAPLLASEPESYEDLSELNRFSHESDNGSGAERNKKQKPAKKNNVDEKKQDRKENKLKKNALKLSWQQLKYDNEQ